MALTLLTTNTESGDANSAFTSSIDSTYKLYIFKYVNINPATDNTDFMFNGSTDGGSNYNVTKTTSMWRSYHDEADSTTAMAYDASYDRAQSTDYQWLTYDIGNLGDECASGILWLFNPSNTTYVKHFYSKTVITEASGYCVQNFMGGYFNTTSAINAVDFKMDSGNFDGTITMWGV